jgi:hypothetical protein
VGLSGLQELALTTKQST